MINRAHALPLCKHTKVLGLSRGSVYYRPRPANEARASLMRRIDELHLNRPFAGSKWCGTRSGPGCGPSEPGPWATDLIYVPMLFFFLHVRLPRTARTPTRPPGISDVRLHVSFNHLCNPATMLIPRVIGNQITSSLPHIPCQALVINQKLRRTYESRQIGGATCVYIYNGGS